MTTTITIREGACKWGGEETTSEAARYQDRYEAISTALLDAAYPEASVERTIDRRTDARTRVTVLDTVDGSEDEREAERVVSLLGAAWQAAMEERGRRSWSAWARRYLAGERRRTGVA